MVQPACIAPQRPCRQKFLFDCRSREPAIQTAPTPVFRPLHLIRSQSIAFHIPADGQKVVIVLNRKRFESPLIKMTRPSRFAIRMPPLRVSQCQPAHKARQLIIFLRPHHQVPVISHQTIRQQARSGSSHCFLKHRLKRDEVFILRGSASARSPGSAHDKSNRPELIVLVFPCPKHTQITLACQ